MTTLAPQTEDQVRDAVREAGSRDARLEIRGGGTHADFGAPDRDADILSLAGVSGIIEYDPPELVLTARAGTPLAEIRQAVAEKNQTLVFEPYGAEGATIGGVIGAAVSGSRRVSAGAVRDHLLGFRAVSGRGEAFLAGAKVVKNVTGYDLPKLMCGSWGRLAALTEVTLKVLPASPEVRTLMWSGLDTADAWSLMSHAMRLPADVSAAAHVPAGIGSDTSRTLLRIEGFAPSVAARAERLDAEFSKFGAPEKLDRAAGEPVWQELLGGALLGGEGALWRLAVPLGKGAAIAAACEAMGARWIADWAGGLIWSTVDGHEEAIRALASDAGGHATLVRAPAEVRARVPALQPVAPGNAALAARVRRAFDPLGIFEAGRFLDDSDAD